MVSMSTGHMVCVTLTKVDQVPVRADAHLGGGSVVMNHSAGFRTVCSVAEDAIALLRIACCCRCALGPIT